MKWLLLIFLIVGCSTLSTNKLTHWNIQLTKYNERFEKRLSMAKNSLWVVDPSKVSIDKIFLKNNKFYAYQNELTSFDKSIYSGIAIEYRNVSFPLNAKNVYVILNDFNDIDPSFNPDGVILKGIYFKALQNKKLSELDQFVMDLKKKGINILSVEFSASLHLMQQYQKFITKHDLFGLVTDSKFSGATFLHFVGQ